MINNVPFNETSAYFCNESEMQILENNSGLNGLIKSQLDNLTVLYATHNNNYADFINNPLSNKVYKLDDSKSYAVMKEDKMVALILRKLMPQNMIESFKNTKFVYQDPTRGSAGVTFSPNGESLKNEFEKLNKVSMELSPVGKYIFSNANIDGRKDIIFDVKKQEGVLTGFKIFTPLKVWSSLSPSLSVYENEILKKVPTTGVFKNSGTFESKYYYQNKFSKTTPENIEEKIVAEIDLKSRKNFDRSVLSINVGSTACKGSKANSKVVKSSVKPDSVNTCTPTSFKKCGIINDIRNLANNIFKNLDAVSESYSDLTKMLSEHKKNVKKLASWCDDGYFSNIIVNFTYLNKPTTNFHKDKNVAPQNLAALLVTGTGYTGGETAMPELLVDNKVLAVEMKEGDYMLFQSKDLIHGNLPVKQNYSYDSPSIPEHAHNSENRRSLVFYLDSRFDQCNHEFNGTPQDANVRLLLNQNKKKQSKDTQSQKKTGSFKESKKQVNKKNVVEKGSKAIIEQPIVYERDQAYQAQENKRERSFDSGQFEVKRLKSSDIEMGP